MSIYRSALTALLAATGASCMRMRTVQPGQVIPEQHPASVWVYTGSEAAQYVTVVLAPRLDGDTIRGTDADFGKPFAVSLKDVVEVQAKERDDVETAVLVGGVILGGGVLVYEVAHKPGSTAGIPNNPSTDRSDW